MAEKDEQGLGSYAAQSACDYDEMVDWAKRLLRESGFFRDLFQLHGVEKVVDVGCGTGKHALLFASWGLRVTGIDPSVPMLEQARINAVTEQADVPFLEGSFEDLPRLVDAPVDAIVTLGNGLPHVEGVEGLRRALAGFSAVLRPGGIVVLHLLNHDKLLSQRPKLLNPFIRETKSGERVYLKLLQYTASGIDFEFITLTRGGAETWEVSSRRSMHTAMPSHLLHDELRAAGFAEPVMYGDHYGKRFDPEHDESVIVIAAKKRLE